jgi:hypothetical protein
MQVENLSKWWKWQVSLKFFFQKFSKWKIVDKSDLKAKIKYLWKKFTIIEISVNEINVNLNPKSPKWKKESGQQF